jgi:hypothetical protein
MKRTFLSGLGLALVLACAPSHVRAQGFAALPPENGVAPIRISPDFAELVLMKRAGQTDEQVISAIKLFPRQYNATPEDVENLKRLGLSNRLIAAMRAHDKALLKQWRREAAVRVGEYEPETGVILSPKMMGGSPAAPEIAMRDEAPLVRVPPRKASTNPPAHLARGWTSSIIVEHAPPPPRLELRPESPGQGYVWVNGYWQWREGGWTWNSGQWLRKPLPTADWMDGYWQRHARGWIWVPGSWK